MHLSNAGAKVTAQKPTTRPVFPRAIELLAAVLLVAAFLSIQALIGGTRLLFALPSYGMLAIIGVLCILILLTPRPAPDQLCLWSAVVFFGYILGRAILSPVPYLARLDACSVLAGLVVYLFTSCVFTSAKARISVFACLLVGALAHVFVGAMQFRGGNNFMPIPFLQRFDYAERASGFYICPNHLAGLLEVLGLFGLSILCWSRWPVWAKLLAGYATALCYVGVVLTGSRGGYLSVVVSLLLFAVLSVSILRAAGASLLIRIGGASFVLAAIALLSTFWLVQKSDFLTNRARKVVDQKNIRLELWQAAIDQWKLEPALGTGSRTYEFYGRKFRRESVQTDPIYAHNDYLQLLSDYGAVGFVLFGAFFFAHWRRGWINSRRLGPKRIAVSHRLSSNAMALNLAAMTSLAAYAVHSIFDFNLHIPANVLVVAFVFGILANSGVIYDDETARTHPGLVTGRILLFGIALVLGFQVWRAGPGEYYAEYARQAVRDNRPLAAMRFALQGLQYQKQDPLLYYYLGRARTLAAESSQNPAIQTSFYQASLEAFQRARDLVPLDKTYPLELAFTYDALQRFGEAEWMFSEAISLDPKSKPTRQYYEAHLTKWAALGLSTQPDTP